VAFAAEAVEDTGLNIELLDEICEDSVKLKATYLAIIEHESYFDESALHLNSNGTYDYGLGQINEVAFDLVSEELDISSMQDLLDGDTNLKAMEVLLDYHLEATDNLDLAVLRYQLGNGAYSRLISSGVYTTETHQEVLSLRDEYLELLG
jgi:hypothetical protein